MIEHTDCPHRKPPAGACKSVASVEATWSRAAALDARCRGDGVIRRILSTVGPRLFRMQPRVTIMLAVMTHIFVGCGCIFSANRVPSPRSDVPLVFEIDWWPNQNIADVESFRVEVVHANLNFLNNTALIRMHISGTLHPGRSRWHPRIGRVHVSERFSTDSEGKRNVDILVTPIVELEQRACVSAPQRPFHIVVEKHIRSYRWGVNEYVLRSGNYSQTVSLTQHK